MDERKKKVGWCGTILILLLILATLIVSLAAYAYNNILGKINRVDGSEVTLSQEEIEAIENETDPPEELTGDLDEHDGVLDENADLIAKGDHIINILLIGQDRRPGETRARSDSMILCTIDAQEKTLVMTSFLRDLYVDIPDWNGRTYQDNRLNACYAFGGMGMLDLALEKNFGIQVDNNLEVDFSGFEKIINIFGGVTIDLTKAEANYLGGGLKEGTNFLNPEQALAYSRIRYLDSDFGRTNRQRNVLTALFNSMKNMNSDQLSQLINNILPMITTDMTNADITGYMVKLIPILPELEITTQHIPAPGTYKSCYVRGMAVLVPDLEANRAILRETLE